MARPVLDESRIHPAIRAVVANHHSAIVNEVQQLLQAHTVVVVGMRFNPVCSRARKLLLAAGVAHHYVAYGGYFSQWRLRNALKLWTGWPTFPMVFVKGQLVGGADDLKRLVDAQELATLVAAK